jgi:hypothetical protein
MKLYGFAQKQHFHGTFSKKHEIFIFTQYIDLKVII